MPGLDIIFLIFAVCAFAGFIQRSVGFGFGIIAMVFLPYFINSYGEATALAGLCSIWGTIYTAYQYRKKIDYKSVIFLACGCMLTTIFAISFMKTQTNEVLVKMLGFILVLTALYFAFLSGKIRIKANPRNAVLTGVLGGVLNGLFGAGGPPVVVYTLSAHENDKEAYIGTIQAYFALTGLYSAIVRTANGFVTISTVKLIPFGIIGVFLGIFIGNKLFCCINAKILKYCVYGLIAVSGIIMLFK